MSGRRAPVSAKRWRVPGTERARPERAERGARVVPASSRPRRGRSRPARGAPAPPSQPENRAEQPQPPASMRVPSWSRVAPWAASTSAPTPGPRYRWPAPALGEMAGVDTPFASCSGPAEPGVDCGSTQDVEPPGRVLRDCDGGPFRELDGHHGPLLVAAAQGRRRHPRPWRGDRKLVEQCRRSRLGGAPIHRAPHDPGIRWRGPRRCSRSASSPESVLGGAVLGDEGDQLRHLPDATEGMDAPSDRARQASRWPFPSTAATPTISPAVTVRDAPRNAMPSSAYRATSTASNRTSRRRARAGRGEQLDPFLHGPFADHRRRGSAAVMSAIPAESTTPAVDTVTRVGRGECLVQLVRDRHGRAAPGCEAAEVTPRRSPTSAGASTAVGSSSRRNRASAASAFTISSRCLRATLRCSTRASGSRGRPARSLASFTRRRSRAGATGHPAVSATFSATVNAGTDVKCWWTIPIPSRRASRGDSRGRAMSSTSTTPASGWRRPAAICMRVVLPAPFSPRSAWTSPGGT